MAESRQLAGLAVDHRLREIRHRDLYIVSGQFIDPLFGISPQSLVVFLDIRKTSMRPSVEIQYRRTATRIPDRIIIAMRRPVARRWPARIMHETPPAVCPSLTSRITIYENATRRHDFVFVSFVRNRFGGHTLSDYRAIGRPPIALVDHRTQSLGVRHQFGVARLIPVPIRRFKVLAQLVVGRSVHPRRAIRRAVILSWMLSLTVDFRVRVPKPKFSLFHLVV